jgi:hypothetical protein
MKHMSELYHSKYVSRVFLPTLSPHGSPRAFYCLDTKGFNHLKSQGLAGGRFKGTEQVKRRWLFLQHTEQSNDLMILAHLLAKNDSRVDVARMKTERELRHQPVYVRVGQEKVGVVPDGWIDLRAADTTCLAFELDRDTVERQAWGKKIRAYNLATLGNYQEVFQTDRITISIVTTAGQRRVKELIHWTEDELRQIGDTSLGELMMFSSFDPASLDPISAFCSNLWQQPFKPSYYPLLPERFFG